jgi:hypothetical protein
MTVARSGHGRPSALCTACPGSLTNTAKESRRTCTKRSNCYTRSCENERCERHGGSPDPSAVFGSPIGQGLPLVADANGSAFVVTSIAAPLAKSRFWGMLLVPH